LKTSESVAQLARPIPMSLLLLTALAVHLPLLIAELPLKSYDANFHIFFASHYAHHWFNPWNTKWFAGFSQTTYPPLTQQWMALVSWVTGLNMAYMVVQLAAILLLVVGVYRFSLLWVSPRAASFAALASVFLGSEAILVYSAGQLATTASAPIYLNALPYMFEWIRHGRWRSFLKGSALFVAAAAAHHVTLLFGSFFFAVPVLALVFLDPEGGDPTPTRSFVVRTVVIVAAVSVAIAIVLLPYWIALFRYPITQTPIPHASRANYILSPQFGLNYFLAPYGAVLLALPFIVIRGSRVVRLRPLLIGFWLAFLIGLGGTTPVGSVLLGRAYHVLTFERFSYWAALLSLPFVGLLAAELFARFRMRAAVPLALLATSSCAYGVSWTTFHPNTSNTFRIAPIANWLNRNQHDKFRYVTLGFGSNQISRLAILTDAGSVDGASNSARMLPELTKYGGAALTDSKYYGESGMDSLRAMLRHADRYGLRWVIVADPYYDPLLEFAGWRQVDTLDGKTITLWSKDGVPPARPRSSVQQPPPWQGIMWGILPIGSSILAILVLFIPDDRRRTPTGDEAAVDQDNLTPGSLVS